MRKVHQKVSRESSSHSNREMIVGFRSLMAISSAVQTFGVGLTSDDFSHEASFKKIWAFYILYLYYQLCVRNKGCFFSNSSSTSIDINKKQRSL